MSSSVTIVMPKTAVKVVEKNRQAAKPPTYQELEAALRSALARIEIMEEYSRRQLALMREVVNPWKN